MRAFLIPDQSLLFNYISISLKHDQSLLLYAFMQSPLVKESKVGPWGGNGKGPFDIPSAPQSLNSMTIASDEVCFSLAFSYTDKDGKGHTVGPFGGKAGHPTTVSTRF